MILFRLVRNVSRLLLAGVALIALAPLLGGAGSGRMSEVVLTLADRLPGVEVEGPATPERPLPVRPPPGGAPEAPTDRMHAARDDLLRQLEEVRRRFNEATAGPAPGVDAPPPGPDPAAGAAEPEAPRIETGRLPQVGGGAPRPFRGPPVAERKVIRVGD
jgi:hypothetical protein